MYDAARGDKVRADQEVDLGLTITIGTKNYKVIFANANLTATGLAENETDYGDYCAWGATEPWYSSLDNSLSDCNKWTATWDKSDGYIQTNCPSYDNDSEYVEDGVLKKQYDPARQILGGDWQLPTKKIWVNLKEACRTSNYSAYCTPIDGCKGCQGKRMTGNIQYIFLPAAGHIAQTWFNSYGSKGYYWSGTAYADNLAWFLGIDPDKSFNSAIDAQVWAARRYGFSVRPVRLVEE